MKISVIIPIYNSEQYVKRCVDSILEQTFSNFELLLINDGSTDKSGDICDALAKQDSRISVFHTANNGVSEARNHGLKHAKGEYITFIDSDDHVPKNYLQELYKGIYDADISVCDIYCIKNGVETTRFTCEKHTLNQREAIELLLSRKQINSGPCGKLFKRNVIGTTLFPKMKTYEDILFVLEVFNKATQINSTSNTEYIYDNGTGGAMTEYAKHPTTDVVTMAEVVFAYLDDNKGKYTDNPEYTTFSHLMQHLQGLSEESTKTNEQLILISSICSFFKKHKKRIRNNTVFTFKEKMIFYFAAHGYWLKGGIRKI